MSKYEPVINSSKKNAVSMTSRIKILFVLDSPMMVARGALSQSSTE
jgi:hypothetical protein